MNDGAKELIKDFMWLCLMVLCMFGAFAIGIGWGIENGKHIQMATNQKTLASCQELLGKNK
jgi:hypothetical protein